MKLIKCEYNGPDSDDDINFDIEAAYENKSDHDVEWAKSSCLIINKDGIAIGGSQDDESDVYIEPDETETFSVYAPYLRGANFNGDIDSHELIVDTTFYRSEFHKMGEHPVPESAEKPSLIANGFEIGDMIKVLGTNIFLRPVDEDGEQQIEVNVGIRNVSDVHFEKVELKVELLDKKGNEIEESSDYHATNAFSSRTLSATFWGQKPSRLKACTLKLSLSVFQPIGSATVAGKLTKG